MAQRLTTDDTMKTVVSFTAPQLSDAEDARNLSCAQIAQDLRESLSSIGAIVHGLEQLDYASHFNVKLDDDSFYVMCGYVGDGLRQWMVSVDNKRGLLKRLFSGAQADGKNFKVIVNKFHNEVSIKHKDVRWYTLDDWNSNPDEAYSTTP